MLYQICIIEQADKEKKVKATVKQTYTLHADNINQATTTAQENHDRKTMELQKLSIRVYPYCITADKDGNPILDGEATMELARHTLRSVERWERSNDNAVLEPVKRTAEDREDFIMTACEAFASVFAENPSANMHEMKTAGFSAIRREQAKRDRNSEREYNPGFASCNLLPRVAKATFPDLDRLIMKAVETADLTEKQAEILNMSYQDGMSAQDIADAVGVKRNAIYRLLYKAYDKVLSTMVELDPSLRAFTEARYTAEEVQEVQAIMAHRANFKK